MVLDGPARKISLVLVIFSIIGWIAFVVGFGLRFHENNENSIFHEDYFPYWCFTVGSPFLFISYFFHLYFNVKFTHYLSIFFTAIYFIPAGGVMYANGVVLANSIKEETYRNASSSDYWNIVEFVGIAFSVLFYWLSMMLWPCFAAKKKTKGYYDY